MNHRTGILFRLLTNYLFTCSNCGLTYIWNGNQDRVKDTGNNKSADTLNDVCRDVHNNIPHFILSQKIFSMLALSGTPSLVSVPSNAAKTSRTL